MYEIEMKTIHLYENDSNSLKYWEILKFEKEKEEKITQLATAFFKNNFEP